MKKNIFGKILLVVFLFLSLTLLTGCIKFSSNKSQTATGPLGIYKSEDASASWAARSDISNVEGKKINMASVSINKIVMDPSDYNTLYASTNKGLFYTYDAAKSWQRIGQFRDYYINDVAVNHFDKCIVYVSAGQSIYRTEDCLRTWQEVYFDKSRADLQIREVETENYNKNFVYAATNKGDILKSVDAGKTWKTIQRIDANIIQILVDKNDTRIVYFLTDSKGIFKTIDGGANWSHTAKETDLNEALKSYRDAGKGYVLVQDMTSRDTFIYASRYGLLKTTNGGLEWKPINLITKERVVTIYSLAVDPKNSDNIYYGTDNTIYKSTDGGQNWATQKSPSGQIISFLLIHPDDPKIIYLGAKEIPKK